MSKCWSREAMKTKPCVRTVGTECQKVYAQHTVPLPCRLYCARGLYIVHICTYKQYVNMLWRQLAWLRSCHATTFNCLRNYSWLCIGVILCCYALQVGNIAQRFLSANEYWFDCCLGYMNLFFVVVFLFLFLLWISLFEKRRSGSCAGITRAQFRNTAVIWQ